MSVLLGDTSGNNTVNASDIAQTKAQSGSAASATNFRNDVNIDGAVNASDIALVKSRSGMGTGAAAVDLRFTPQLSRGRMAQPQR